MTAIKLTGVFNENKSIVNTKIFVEWNDNPKMEILMNDMPSELTELWDEWLSDIENEENAKNGRSHNGRV